MAFLSQSLMFFLPSSLPFFQAKCRTPLVQPLIHTTLTKGHGLSIRLASSSKESHSISDLVELPIYPLPLVLFPGAVFSLQVLEFRDRMMMHTLLQTDLKFGVLFSNPMPSATEHFSLQVGCVAEVVKHQMLVDDHFFITCKGLWFRIARINRTEPYMMATVTRMEDWPIDLTQGAYLEKLASEVEGYMKDVIRLGNRLEGKNQDDQNNDFDLRKGQLPTPFSFFVASNFVGAPEEQQELLEMEDTAARLEREIDMLKTTINYLIAVLSVKDAFPSSS